jgi:cell division septation protein DedD
MQPRPVEPKPAPAQAAAPAPRETSAPPPVVTASPVPTSRGWAVQLGSFASRATADRMVKDMAQQGQKAFVMPVKSGSNTLYRVRIGPFADRNVANDALRDVKGQVANAAVVAHP